MERKNAFKGELAYSFGDLGEAELILRIWGAKENTFRELRNFGRSVHYFQGSREHRPRGASILYSLSFDVFSRRYIREALPKWWG